MRRYLRPRGYHLTTCRGFFIEFLRASTKKYDDTLFAATRLDNTRLVDDRAAQKVLNRRRCAPVNYITTYAELQRKKRKVVPCFLYLFFVKKNKIVFRVIGTIAHPRAFGKLLRVLITIIIAARTRRDEKSTTKRFRTPAVSERASKVFAACVFTVNFPSRRGRYRFKTYGFVRRFSFEYQRETHQKLSKVFVATTKKTNCNCSKNQKVQQ